MKNVWFSPTTNPRPTCPSTLILNTPSFLYALLAAVIKLTLNPLQLSSLRKEIKKYHMFFALCQIYNIGDKYSNPKSTKEDFTNNLSLRRKLVKVTLHQSISPKKPKINAAMLSKPFLKKLLTVKTKEKNV